MPLCNITYKQIFFFIKLLAAVIIFYIGLDYAVLPVGEDFSAIVQKDYLGIPSAEYLLPSTGSIANQYIQEALQEIANESSTVSTGQGHFSAPNNDAQYQNKFSTICFSNITLCNVINWVGNYTWQDKYLYISSIFSVINFIQGHRVIGDDIVSVLHSITIDNSVGNRRGYATHNDIIFNLGSVRSRLEFIGLVAHEFGHIYDLGALQGVSSNKSSVFTEFGKAVFAVDDLSLQYYANSRKSETIRKPGSSKKNFCSGYGMQDPFEDFAECFNLYVNHNSLFKAMAKSDSILKKKYNFIASLFGGDFLHANQNDVTYAKNNPGWRPTWDTTTIGL